MGPQGQQSVLTCTDMTYSTVQALQSLQCLSVAHQQTVQAPAQGNSVMPAICNLCYLITSLCVLGGSACILLCAKCSSTWKPCHGRRPLRRNMRVYARDSRSSRLLPVRPRCAWTLAYRMVPLKSSGFCSYFTCCPPVVRHLVATSTIRTVNRHDQRDLVLPITPSCFAHRGVAVHGRGSSCLLGKPSREVSPSKNSLNRQLCMQKPKYMFQAIS